MRTQDIITSRAMAPTKEQILLKDQFFKAAMALMLTLATIVAFTSQVLAQESFADLIEEVQPAVVNITTVQLIKAPRTRGFPQLQQDAPFGDLLDKFRNKLEDDQEPIRRRAAGSGFVIDAAGYVVTNHHVINEADTITVIFTNGDEYEATVVGSDSLTDLALLKIEGDDNFPYVSFGSSSAARIGDWVLAIGNPFAIGSSVSAGIISARDRENNGPYVDFIQTDAAINHGNSGGPLFNMDGEVIGINSQIISPNGGNVGMGFSIPSDDAKGYLDQLREHGKVQRSWLGVTIEDIDDDIQEGLGLESSDGVLVSDVTDGAPADIAGIQAGDIIASWNGKTATDLRTLRRLVAMTQVGGYVDVGLLRDNQEIVVSIQTIEMPKAEEEAMLTGRRPKAPRAPEIPTSDVFDGMEISDINGAFLRRFNIDSDVKGVAVTAVKRNSLAYRKGVRPGIVIESVSRVNVENVADLLDRIEDLQEEGRDNVILRILQEGRRRHVSLPLKEKDED